MEVTHKLERKNKDSPGVLAAAAGYRIMESWRESAWERTCAVSSSVLGAQGSSVSQTSEWRYWVGSRTRGMSLEKNSEYAVKSWYLMGSGKPDPDRQTRLILSYMWIPALYL